MLTGGWSTRTQKQSLHLWRWITNDCRTSWTLTASTLHFQQLVPLNNSSLDNGFHYIWFYYNTLEFGCSSRCRNLLTKVRGRHEFSLFGYCSVAFQKLTISFDSSSAALCLWGDCVISLSLVWFITYMNSCIQSELFPPVVHSDHFTANFNQVSQFIFSFNIIIMIITLSKLA